jgi:ribokinase
MTPDEAAVPRPAGRPVVVVGSLNLDLIVRTDRIPRPGETVLAQDFARAAGGKGSNQAVAAARLGADVALIGRLGDDANGREIRNHLESTKVRLDYVRDLPGAFSGLAVVMVDADGENAIVVLPGANQRLLPEALSSDLAAVQPGGVAVAQLEIPLPTVELLAQRCVEREVDFVLNAAPYQAISDELLSRCAYLIVNRDEAASLSGRAISNKGEAHRAAQLLSERGAASVVVTLGSAGCIAWHRGEALEIASYAVDVADTTGAGDAFVGAFVAALAGGGDFPSALTFAAAAGALTCEMDGAQHHDLTRERVRELIGSQPQLAVRAANRE